MKDGARVAFWLTSIEERKEVPIVEGMPELGTQTQVTWKEQFVSGIETPLFGLVGSLLAKLKKSIKCILVDSLSSSIIG